MKKLKWSFVVLDPSVVKSCHNHKQTRVTQERPVVVFLSAHSGLIAFCRYCLSKKRRYSPLLFYITTFCLGLHLAASVPCSLFRAVTHLSFVSLFCLRSFWGMSLTSKIAVPEAESGVFVFAVCSTKPGSFVKKTAIGGPCPRHLSSHIDHLLSCLPFLWATAAFALVFLVCFLKSSRRAHGWSLSLMHRCNYYHDLINATKLTHEAHEKLQMQILLPSKDLGESGKRGYTYLWPVMECNNIHLLKYCT